MQGLSMNRDQPVKIESNALEVRDKIRQATFSGDVKLTQGDTTLKCKMLVVFYEDTAMAPGKKGAPAQAPAGAKERRRIGGQQIKRAEAKGDVFVTQKDQTASGDNGVYDQKPTPSTMTGNVVVTQGPHVMRGERMVVESDHRRDAASNSANGPSDRNADATRAPQRMPAPAGTGREAGTGGEGRKADAGAASRPHRRLPGARSTEPSRHCAMPARLP